MVQPTRCIFDVVGIAPRASAFADFMARIRMDLANRQFAIMDERTVREMRVIDFIHTHLWMVIAYVAVFLACLLWLESRPMPRWSVWVTFIVLALPALAYGNACLHIGNKFIHMASG
jgi:hypothetical protein